MKNIYIWPILGDLNNEICSLQGQKQFYYLNQNDINNIIDMKCVCANGIDCIWIMKIKIGAKNFYNGI